jgi:protein SCO1/2
MDRSGTSMTRRLLLCATVFGVGGALFVSGAGSAHDVGHPTMPAAHQHLAHAEHQHAAMPDTAPGAYARAVRSYTVPDVMLVDQDAKPVRLRELLAADEPVMMNFIFTTCTAICPVMTKIFSNVPQQLGTAAGKLRMISISIDPENDTPPQLKAYAGKFDAGPRWQFLTGSVENVATVQRAFGTYSSDKMRHEPLTLLRSAPGKPWVRIDGFASPEDLAREYQRVAQK